MGEFKRAAQTILDAKYQDPVWRISDHTPPTNLSDISQRAIDVYMLSKKPNGEMGGIGWWQSANGYTAMALRDLWSRNRENFAILRQILRQCERNHSGFINAWNDDSLWWAMCCMHMYSMNHEAWYLDKAKGIWQHIRDSGSVCKRGDYFFNGRDMEGAVFWTTRPGEDSINAISTSLYAELSARLALAQINKFDESSSFCGLFKAKDTSTEEYIEAAKRSLGWIIRHRYRAEEGVVLDHIKLKESRAVDWVFTYNAGVVIGTFALLYELTREEECIALACHMARKAMTRSQWIDEDGVLTASREYGYGKNDPLKNNDSVGFKAVLIRQLCTLYDVIVRTNWIRFQDDAVLIKSFINANLESQLNRNTNGKGQYGPWWAGPFERPTSHSQMAALDVFAAAVLVNRW